jgi:hypothetical protein
MGAGGSSSEVEVAGRVSVVTPSMSRRKHFHEQLWASFEAQTWPDKELIVLETYTDEPSAFLRQKAKEDSRLVHVCIHREEDEDFSVGLKRDMTLHLASGEFIVNFDDDDIYAPSYISKMVGEMKARNLVGLTLSSWYNYLVQDGFVGYTDPRVKWEVPLEQLDERKLDEVLYGYGFSYVHLRRPALALPYPDVVFAEDAPFFLGLRERFGRERVALKQDTEGLCMHLVHRANSAGHMPVVREVSQAEVKALDVAPLFQRYLDQQGTTLLQQYRSLVAKCHLAVEPLRDLWQTPSMPSLPSVPSLPSAPSLPPASSWLSVPEQSAHNHRRVKSC